MRQQQIWVVRAGRHDEAHSLFLDSSVVALGWQEMSDLSQIAPDREAFKAALAKVYPSQSPFNIAINTGQLYRFVHEVKLEDLVLYPSKIDREIHIGRVTGCYNYKPQHNLFPHQRSVKWLKSVQRVQFSQGALYEINSALTVFQVKTYADEVRSALERKDAAPVPVREDPTVPLVQTDIEETTRDFIIKTLAQELKGHPFAEFVAHLLGTMGYRCRVSQEGADGGIDIIAHRDELGFEPPIIKVQVKSGEGGTIGDPVVAALYGKVDPKEFGLFVTLGAFTNQAKQFARGKANLRLIDGTELVDLILTHYDQFDSRYKGVLPLKRVYVPDPDEAVQE